MSAAPVDLVGVWKLTGAKYEWCGDNDEVIEYLGSNPQGSLIYTADGHMQVQLMASGRPHFSSDDRLGGTDEEVRAAFQGYHAYFGRYSIHVEAGCIVHHIKGCTYPNFVGTDQTRYFGLHHEKAEGSQVGDVLTLRTSPLLMRGKPAVGHLVWERVSS